MNLLTDFLTNNALWVVIGGSLIIGFLWGFIAGSCSIHEQGLREYVRHSGKKVDTKPRPYHTID